MEDIRQKKQTGKLDDYEDDEDEDEYEQEDDHQFYGSELESEADDFDIMV